MAQQLTAQDAKLSLNAHVAAKGAEIFTKYGPVLAWSQLPQLLADRTCVRYPVELVFDASALNPGEFAHPEPKGSLPEDGFTLHIHPVYMTQLESIPALVLYQLVAVNYGEFASSDDAETFGAAALGMDRNDYYALLCELADQLGAPADVTSMAGDGCRSGGCGCH